MKKTFVGFFCEPELKLRLDEAAQREERTTSLLCRRVLREHLKKMDETGL